MRNIELECACAEASAHSADQTPQNAAPRGGPVLNEPEPNDIIDNRFVIIQTINRGGMAWIYKALDKSTGKNVALKIPLTHCECDVHFYSRFQREEAIGLTLDHPSVVKFIPAGVRKSRPYIAMEFLHGQTLAQRLRQSSPLPEAEAARIACQICDALLYLHRNGILHRDLKPENVMLCDDGSIRIMDFGIAKSGHGKRLTFGGFSSAMGTPDYISPEQVKGKRGDARTDLYSLGAMLYVMTTGVPPYEGDNPYIVMNARLSGDPQAPRQANPKLSPQIEEIILHAMERNPSDRYLSAAAMKRELQDYNSVALEQRFRRLRAPGIISTRFPLAKKIALILAVQLVAFFLLLWHFNHARHGRPELSNAVTVNQSSK